MGYFSSLYFLLTVKQKARKLVLNYKNDVKSLSDEKKMIVIGLTIFEHMRIGKIHSEFKLFTREPHKFNNIRETTGPLLWIWRDLYSIRERGISSRLFQDEIYRLNIKAIELWLCVLSVGIDKQLEKDVWEIWSDLFSPYDNLYTHGVHWAASEVAHKRDNRKMPPSTKPQEKDYEDYYKMQNYILDLGFIEYLQTEDLKGCSITKQPDYKDYIMESTRWTPSFIHERKYTFKNYG